MHCPNCNTSLQPNARFCGTCGHRLDQPQCPNCQAPVNLSHRFCARCGWDLQQAQPPVSEPVSTDTEAVQDKPAPEGRRRRWGILILAAVVIVVLAAAAWYVVRTLQPSQEVGTAVLVETPVLTPAEQVPPPVEETEEVEESEELQEPQSLWQAVQDAVEAGDTLQAVQLLQQLRSDHPNFEPQAVGDQLYTLCRAWYDDSAESISPEVLAALDCLARVRPEDPAVAQQAWWKELVEAKEHLLAGEAAQAIDLLESMIAAAPSDFAQGRHKGFLYEAYLQQGDAACAAEDFEAARASYIKARTLDPTRLEAGNRIASCQPPTPTPTITPAPTLTPTPLPPGAMVISYTQEERLNLRMGPGLNYPIVGRAEAGAVFTATGRSEDAGWLKGQRPGGGEVWMSGEVVEANYPFVAAPVVEIPLPPSEFVIADSVRDFSTKQGENGWYYLASRSPGSLDYDWMPAEGGWYRWTKSGRSPEMRLSAEGSYPSWNSDTMRLWSSMYEGTVRIEGQAHKEVGAGRGGNGVALRVVLLSTAENGDTTLDQELWSDTLGAYDTSGYKFTVDPFEIRPGGGIYFVTSASGDDRKDNTVFTSRIILVNEGGVVLTPTPTPEPTPVPTPRPPLCFEPRQRHFEDHKGCCGEVVGIAYTNQGRLSWGQVHIEGPPATNQYRMDFAINKDGGYEITALNMFADYTIWLKGARIRSSKFVVHYEDLGKVRAVVDFYQVSCR